MSYTTIRTETAHADDQAEKKSHMGHSMRSPWKSMTTLMGVALIAGIIIAVGHHLFYHFLNGQHVDQVIPQVWVINIATAFTFLCKTFLVLAAATAFAQCEFRDLRRKGLNVEDVDSLSQMLGDPLGLLLLKLWWKVPIACFVAVVAW